jgi:1-acyl-sn-glycerol-3-phosphate acyltransferase
VIHDRAGRVLRFVRWTRLLAHVAAALFILRFVFPRASSERRRQLHGWWSRKLVRIVGIDTHVEGVTSSLAGYGARCGMMVAANHVSWLDVFCVSSVRPTRFIAKSEVRDWPVAGWIAERAGTLFVRRARRRDTARINDVVHGALAQGDCVGLFPEGTTTPGDRLLRFHSSLFEPAVANDVEVQPIAIRYEHADGSLCRAVAYDDLSFMQSLALMLRQRNVVARLSFLETLPASGRTRREVARAAEACIATRLGLPSPSSELRTPAGLPGEPQ